MSIHWLQAIVPPDSVRNDWNVYLSWVSMLSPADREIWETLNDDDGPDTRFIPGVIDQGGRQVGADVCAALGSGPAYGWNSRQELMEWWLARNPHHNRDFVTNFKPVTAPKYIIGNPGADPRYEMNKTLVWRTDPFFSKVGPAIYGWRSDKPPFPAPKHWIPRPPFGGALDRGVKNYSYP